MDLLNSDMGKAVDETGISDRDKKLVRDILYNERRNKERDEVSYGNEAAKYIQSLLEKAEGIEE